MSVAYYIVTQDELDDFDVFVNGKALGHLEEDSIDQLCAKAGVPSLLDFLSQNPEELEGFLEDEGIDVEDGDDFPDEAWFSPEQGLLTVRGLISYLQTNPQARANAGDIIAELQEYEFVLLKLAEQNMAWHLALDF